MTAQSQLFAGSAPAPRTPPPEWRAGRIAAELRRVCVELDVTPEELERQEREARKGAEVPAAIVAMRAYRQVATLCIALDEEAACRT